MQSDPSSPAHARSTLAGGVQIGRLAGLFQPELLPQHATQDLLEWFLALGNVLAESLVDQRLIVASTRSVDLAAEPCQEVVVEANRDASLALGHPNYWTSLRLAEIILFSHGFSW